MQIKDETKEKTYVRIMSLKPGTVFLHNNQLFMKLAFVTNSNYSAVDLASGELWQAHDGLKVIPVPNATLTYAL